MGAFKEGFEVGYAEGYTQGKAKVLREIRKRLADPFHVPGCGCGPCLVIAQIRGLRSLRDSCELEQLED